MRVTLPELPSQRKRMEKEEINAQLTRSRKFTPSAYIEIRLNIQPSSTKNLALFHLKHARYSIENKAT